MHKVPVQVQAGSCQQQHAKAVQHMQLLLASHAIKHRSALIVLPCRLSDATAAAVPAAEPQALATSRLVAATGAAAARSSSSCICWACFSSTSGSPSVLAGLSATSVAVDAP